MTTSIALATCLFELSAAGGGAQAPGATAAYRGYPLGASLASVVATSGARDPRPKTQHERPERLQTFEWRAGYSALDDVEADPVRDIQFYFVADELYRIDIRYDRDRTLGLTSGDLVDAISLTYGQAQPEGAPRGAGLRAIAADMMVVRQWALPAGSLALFRGIDTPEYVLVLVSTPLSTRAAGALRAAERLDVIEAPQRAIDARKQDARDAADARERARARNKPAFRP